MKDRIPTKVLPNGAIRFGEYDENGNLLRYVYYKREDEPTELGTPQNKATLMPDVLAAKLGLNPDTATVAGGIAKLERSTDALWYEAYNQYLAGYYTGGTPTSPEFSGAKSLIFDGFTNSAQIDSANSTASVTTAGRGGTVQFAGVTSGKYLTGGTVTNALLSGITLKTTSPEWVVPTGALSSIIDGSETTYIAFVGTGQGDYGRGIKINISLPDGIGVVNSITFKVTASQYNETFLYFLAGTVDGVSYLELYNATYRNSVYELTSAGNTTYTLLPEKRKQYKRFEFTITTRNMEGSGEFDARLYEVSINSTLLNSNSIRSISRDMGAGKTKAKLFVSVSDPSKFSFYCVCDGVRVSGTTVCTRADPRFAGHTEVGIEFALPVGNSGVTAVECVGMPSLVDGVGVVAPTLKRYGMYFM